MIHVRQIFLLKYFMEVIRWAMRKLGVEEWLVSAVMSTYTGAKTVVRTFIKPFNLQSQLSQPGHLHTTAPMVRQL